MEKMPPEISDFPYEVQLAEAFFRLLPDRWEGNSGSYMGKDWSALGALFDIFDINNDKEIITYFLKVIENEYSTSLNAELKQKRDAEMRKAKRGGISIPTTPRPKKVR